MTKLSGCVPNCLKGKVSLRKPEVVSVDDFKLTNLTDECFEILTKLSVYNPNCFSIPLLKISYTVKFANNSEPAVDGTIPKQESLKGNKKTQVDVPVRVKYSVIKDIVNDITHDLDIHCYIHLKLTICHMFTIPYSFDKEIKLIANDQTFSEIWRGIKKIIG